MASMAIYIEKKHKDMVIENFYYFVRESASPKWTKLGKPFFIFQS